MLTATGELPSFIARKRGLSPFSLRKGVCFLSLPLKASMENLVARSFDSYEPSRDEIEQVIAL